MKLRVSAICGLLILAGWLGQTVSVATNAGGDGSNQGVPYLDSGEPGSSWSEHVSNDTDLSRLQNLDGQSAQLDANDLDSTITAIMEAYHIPGLAAKLILNGQTIWTGEFGYANLETSTPVSDTTMFFLAQTSKPFIGAAFMQLWENGVFELDDSINAYLPDTLEVRNPLFPDTPITFRMLAANTSSIRSLSLGQYWVCDMDSPIPLEQHIIDFLTPDGANYNSANFESWAPGTGWRYSTLGMTLAAYLIETITGVPFDQYCNDSIFTPLGMNRTSWTLAGLDYAGLAMPYYWDVDPEGIDSTWYPVGHCGNVAYPYHRLRISASDFARFLTAMMQGGRYGDIQMLESATVDTMTTDHATHLWVTYPYGVGLFWFEGDGEHLLGPLLEGYWGRYGSGPGARTWVHFHKDDNLGQLVLYNLGVPPPNFADPVEYQDWEMPIRAAIDAYGRAYDTDADTVPDVTDNCPYEHNPGQEDPDTDSVGTLCDNCPDTYNPGQIDADSNGVGDLCQCACPCHGDPQCDAVTNVLDVVNAVNVAFRSAVPNTDPLCPYEQTDVSCDSVTNVIDVVKFVNVAFRSGDPAVQFCDPCAQ